MHKGDRPPPTSFLPPESWGSCGGSLTHHKLSVKSTSQSSSLSLPPVDDPFNFFWYFQFNFFHPLLRHMQHQQNPYPTVPWCFGCINFLDFQWTWCGVNPVIGIPPLHPPPPLHSTQHHIPSTWIGWTGSNISAPTWHQINMYLGFNQNFMTAPFISTAKRCS